jgi:hypothetical protein
VTAVLAHIATIPAFLPISVTGEIVLGVTSKGIAQWSPSRQTPAMVAPLPRTLFEGAFGRCRLLQRICRLGMACGHHLDGQRFLVADRQTISLVHLDGAVRIEKTLDAGMRPLRLTRVHGVSGFEDGVYYGDYGPNPGRRPLVLHRRDPGGMWHQAYTFPTGTAEHVHAIVPDRARACLWVFTGDYSDAAAIWQARGGFSMVEPVVRGSQLGRACVGFPIEEGLLYATDSHLEPNSIRLLRTDRGNWETIPVYPMVGSCIYGGVLAGTSVFTTAFEPGEPTGHWLRDLIDLRPGPGIVGRSCQLVSGTLASGFQTALNWEVDWLPKRLFQFSTMIIPDLDLDATLLPVFAMGLRDRDGTTVVYRLNG